MCVYVLVYKRLIVWFNIPHQLLIHTDSLLARLDLLGERIKRDVNTVTAS